MLKKLRRQFVLINMAMISVVVIIVLAVIGGITYKQSVSNVYTAIHESVESAASQSFDSADVLFGAHRDFNATLPDFSSAQPSTSDDTSDDQQYGPKIGNGNDTVTPVAVYRVTTAGAFQMVSRASSAALSDDALSEATSALANAAEGEGELASAELFYVKVVRGTSTYYGFASMSSAANWQGIFAMMVLIGVGALLVFWLLSMLLSRWVVRPVEEAWLKQKQFLADASHELKTPLTVILANSDIMLKHPERTIASQQQWVESTQHEARDMQEMVVSMLDLARLDAEEGAGEVGNASPIREDINLSDLAFGTMLQFESIAFEKSVSLEDDIAEDLHIKGNPSQITRLCGTLLDNACKYAPADSVVTVGLKAVDSASLKGLPSTTYQGDLPKGKVAALTVANTGEPVSAEDLPHLFDRFYRSDKARTHDAGSNSYGLGLAIAAGTVTAHKGCIMATSAEGKGTTFTVALPLATS